MSPHLLNRNYRCHDSLTLRNSKTNHFRTLRPRRLSIRASRKIPYFSFSRIDWDLGCRSLVRYLLFTKFLARVYKSHKLLKNRQLLLKLFSIPITDFLFPPTSVPESCSRCSGGETSAARRISAI